MLQNNPCQVIFVKNISLRTKTNFRFEMFEIFYLFCGFNPQLLWRISAFVFVYYKISENPFYSYFLQILFLRELCILVQKIFLNTANKKRVTYISVVSWSLLSTHISMICSDTVSTVILTPRG